MSLNDQLQQLHQNVLKSFSQEIREKLVEENRKLFNSFLMTKALQTGAVAPDVLFRDKDLQAVRLHDLLKHHHVVLSFYRGTWCPYCTLELKALNQVREQVERRNALIIAVSPELYKYSEDVVRNAQIEFPVLTDLGNKGASKFGLVFELPSTYRAIYEELNLHLNILNADNSWTLPVPATFIISRQGIITSTYIDADYTKRMEPDDILRELDKIQTTTT